MAIESIIRPTGETLYAIYRKRSNGQVWNGSTYEAINTLNFATYDVALAATGLKDINNEEVYTLTHPGGLASEVHDILIWKQAGAGPVMGADTLLGLGESGPRADAAIIAGPDIYHADVQFTRDGSSRDEYTVTWFKNGAAQTSGITAPLIQVVKRVDGTDLVASTAMTQIGATGTYKYTEATNKQTRGEAVLVIVTATIDGSARTWRKPLGRDA